MSELQSKQTNYLGIGAAVVIIAIVIIAIISQVAKPAADENVAVNEPIDTMPDTVIPADTTATADTTPTTPATDPAPTPATATVSTYEDGTYTMVGSYTSPAGPEQLGVTVTLVDDVITAVSVKEMATNPVSIAKQADFAANYQPMVIGKSIDEVTLGKVSGSSLTPKGFNDALDKIQAEAQA